MEEYEVTAARTLSPAGEEFLVISIAPEHYHDQRIRDRWFAAFRQFDMPFVVGCVTSEKEWTLRSERTDLVQHLSALPFGSVDRLGWHRMTVECDRVPWEL